MARFETLAHTLQHDLIKMKYYKQTLIKIASLTLAALVVSGSFKVWATSSSQCKSLFSTQTDVRILPLDPEYAHEAEGRYLDPDTNKYWRVVYLSEQQKARYQLSQQKDGLFVDANGQKADRLWDPETMTYYSSNIFIVDGKGRFFITELDERGKFHHSSLSAGQPVIYAGMAAFEKGRIVLLDDNSGHYKPSPQHTLWFLSYLKSRGVDLSYLTLMGRVVEQIKGPGRAKMNPQEVGVLLESYENP